MARMIRASHRILGIPQLRLRWLQLDLDWRTWIENWSTWVQPTSADFAQDQSFKDELCQSAVDEINAQLGRCTTSQKRRRPVTGSVWRRWGHSNCTAPLLEDGSNVTGAHRLTRIYIHKLFLLLWHLRALFSDWYLPDTRTQHWTDILRYQTNQYDQTWINEPNQPH